jgi:hypothetical protein
MAKIGRNDACPCGSGKKYKHCCLARDNAYERLLQEQRDAKFRAVEWLTGYYAEAVNEAVTNRFFLDEEDEDTPGRLAELPESAQTAVLICLHEWLIAEARLILGEELVRASDLLLGPGGPPFTADGRRHIEELAASELSLYEVLEVHKGEGLRLRDLLRPDEDPVFAREKKATETLVSWDVLGARLLRQGDTYTIGGGVYFFQRGHAKDLADFTLKAIRRETRKKRPRETPKEIITFCIVTNWLDSLLNPPPPPILIDPQTKEPIRLTTDGYRVSDWEALEDILADRDDVEQEDEGAWAWIESIDEEKYRSLARLERLSSGLLEVWCRTEGKGDAARKWLEALAGPLLSHTGREIKDPRETLQDESPSRPDPAAKKRAKEIPPEIQWEIMSKYLSEHYANWPAMPLPALDGKTPLQAAKLKTYRPKLVELLKHLEQGEARRAKSSGLPAFDAGFLWERLGLTRE